MVGAGDPRLFSQGSDRQERTRWQAAMADSQVAIAEKSDGEADQSFRIDCEDGSPA